MCMQIPAVPISDSVGTTVMQIIINNNKFLEQGADLDFA